MFGEIGVYGMVVMIVLIVTIGRMYSARHGINAWRRRGRDSGPDFDPRAVEETNRLKSEVTRLNERIAVLERLATDPAKRLSAEIDALGERKP